MDEGTRAEGELQVWLLDLEQWQLAGGHLTSRAQAALTRADVAAAAAMHPEVARRHLAGRVLARHAIAAAAACEPGCIELHAPVKGKPTVCAPADAARWHFNLSHSGGLVACAVARGAVGIDVERAAPRVDHRLIAQTQFSADEAAWLAQRPQRSGPRFTALWTLKESFLKAVGAGLSVALDTVRLGHEGRGRYRVSSPFVDGDAAWHCVIGRPRRGYWLAVCCRHPPVVSSVRWLHPA